MRDFLVGGVVRAKRTVLCVVVQSLLYTSGTNWGRSLHCRTPPCAPLWCPRVGLGLRSSTLRESTMEPQCEALRGDFAVSSTVDSTVGQDFTVGSQWGSTVSWAAGAICAGEPNVYSTAEPNPQATATQCHPFQCAVEATTNPHSTPH